ncbi:hypothetical protein [Nocardioides bigeumensis]|uniref:Uncharacterized protein n=1 Tax=Nocardioides bigeumensis TaxID=433657 RepID=A0ABN2XZ40_9ACTN
MIWLSAVIGVTAGAGFALTQKRVPLWLRIAFILAALVVIVWFVQDKTFMPEVLIALAAFGLSLSTVHAALARRSLRV